MNIFMGILSIVSMFIAGGAIGCICTLAYVNKVERDIKREQAAKREEAKETTETEN